MSVPLRDGLATSDWALTGSATTEQLERALACLTRHGCDDLHEYLIGVGITGSYEHRTQGRRTELKRAARARARVTA